MRASAYARADASAPAPATAAAVAASAAAVAAAAAAAAAEERLDARSTSKGGTHARSARDDSCSGVRGFARFKRSSSSARARAASATRLAVSAAARALRSARLTRRSWGVPAFSPRRMRSKNICTSAPVGGSHVHFARNAGRPDRTAPETIAFSPPSLVCKFFISRFRRTVPSSRDATSSSASADAEIARDAESAYPSSARTSSAFLRSNRLANFLRRRDASTPSTPQASYRAFMTARKDSGSFTAKDRSSISAFAANMPSCSANEHHTCSVSLATNFAFAGSTAYAVRMLWMRSANLIRKHRGSRTSDHSMRRRDASSRTSTPSKFSLVSAIFKARPVMPASRTASRSRSASGRWRFSNPARVRDAPLSDPPLSARFAAAAAAFSALRRWLRRRICGSFPSVLTSATSVATVSPNASRTSCSSHSVSSTTSCSTHAATASTYFFLATAPGAVVGSIAAKMSAASMQCVTYVSPVRRYCPWCHRAANATARCTVGSPKMGYAEQSTPHSVKGGALRRRSSAASSGKTSARKDRSQSWLASKTPTPVVTTVAARTAGTLKCAPIASYCANPGNRCVSVCTRTSYGRSASASGSREAASAAASPTAATASSRASQRVVGDARSTPLAVRRACARRARRVTRAVHG